MFIFFIFPLPCIYDYIIKAVKNCDIIEMQLKIYKKQPKDGRVQLVESYIIYA